MLIFFQENRNLGNGLCRLPVSVMNGELRERLPEKNFRRKGFILFKNGIWPIFVSKGNTAECQPYLCRRYAAEWRL